MTYEQYWYGKPSLLNNYSNVYNKKGEDKMNWVDTLAHRIGFYVSEALATTPVIPLGVIEGKEIKKILKNKSYPSMPFLTQRQQKDLNTIDVEVTRPTEEQKEAYKKRLAELRNKNSG